MPNVTKSQTNNFVKVSYPGREAQLDITHAEHELILMFSHEKVKMIKFIRGQYNLGLYDAKQVVDTVLAHKEAEVQLHSSSGVETEIDWDTVKEGTWIYVKDYLHEDWYKREFIRYNPASVFSFVCKSSDDGTACAWQRAKLTTC